MTRAMMFRMEMAPPSANSLLINAGGRGIRRKSEYTQWKAVAAACWARERKRVGMATVEGDFEVMILVGPRDRRRDLDNMVKPILDALQAAEVIKNDNRCIYQSIRWSDDVDGCEVSVFPREGAP